MDVDCRFPAVGRLDQASEGVRPPEWPHKGASAVQDERRLLARQMGQFKKVEKRSVEPGTAIRAGSVARLGLARNLMSSQSGKLNTTLTGPLP